MMKISFEWYEDHLCCNSCPFAQWEEDDYRMCGFYCALTNKPILQRKEYDFNNPDERHKDCPLEIERDQA